MTNKPVLRAAAILSSTQLEVCFDKTVQLTSPSATGFKLVGYRAGNNTTISSAAALDPTHTACAIVTFGGAGVDTAQYTVLSVDPNAVVSNASGQGNVPDSVGLTGSASHSGTIGVTTGPNLVGIVPPDGPHLTTDTLTFVFDKNVAAAPLVATSFFFVDGGGNTCHGAGVPVVSGTTVTVSFAASAECPLGVPSGVGSAVRAGVLADAIASKSDLGSHNVSQSAVLPGAPNGGATLRPDVVSTALGSDNDSIAFTFDKNVVVNGTGATTFLAELANGSTLRSTSAVLTSPNTVTARFAGTLAVNAEFGVIGWAQPAAANSSDNLTATGQSVPGSGGIGDNAGAFARAFTTAPDVFGITINKAAGTIAVNLDDRAKTVNTGSTCGAGGTFPCITLYAADGTPISAAPVTTSFNSTAAPGPATVTIQYAPSALTNVASVAFGAGAFITNGLIAPVAPVNAGDPTSVDQLVGPISNAVVLKGFKAVKHTKTHKKAAHKKHAQRHNRKH